ncbi:PDZK1-interacting protein 1 isoform X1 [Dicentrarchus labrax]|uniref:PDZK1-interacting protein 1 isoform X1 n=1 Tax=Dicentrarchus labrax TaxID=13489 RepID=UPI0021F68256|nr:PDZK1-interacting protein 1 isoform X1 [Dicentrarchus labrax]XP_051231636.1 PDZK1-interacting protein 1 isoform X1 [Dicentrarchus labrax]XP_051231637.1 PDZK1-interacting protein 1 isoform X1 [Dicentrarchus labrax]
MGKLCAVTSCLLLTVSAAAAQTAQPQIERLLPQWLTGIIAVSAFLFLVFVTLLVKKAWCEKPSRSVRGKTNVSMNKKKTAVESESDRENEFVVTNGNTYETNLDTIRRKSTVESARENEFENTYETTLEMTGRKSTVESTGENEFGNTYETTLEMVRSKEDPNAFDNLAFGSADDKVTSM